MNQEFKQNKFIYKNTFLDQGTCQQYVQKFKEAIDQGYATNDGQCPLSYSLGHSTLFDSLLEQLTPYIEEATGLNLYPTYAYARWYAPGDELKIHRDREACEITATITLGFEGDSWPIYMGYDQDKNNKVKINMGIGDAVIFKGQELFHWREKYTEGQWQAQVFVHYVDKNGPHAEWKYDKRKKLSHHQNEKDHHGFFHVYKNAFSKEKCKEIEEKFKKYVSSAPMAELANGEVNLDIRNSKKIQLPIDKGLGAMLIGMALQANFNIWKFDITHGNQVEFLNYDEEGKFNIHIDTFLDKIGNTETRKLTFVFILNEEYEGGKLYLQYGRDKIYPPQEAGNVIVFPSFMLHGVEPVIKGNRKTVVGWLAGPYFK